MMIPTADSPDPELMEGFFREGDTQALGILFERHAGWAFGIACAVLRDGSKAEDAVQEAFVRLLRKAPSRDAAQPFLPWLRALVVGAALHRLRSDRRRLAREAHAAAPEGIAEDPAMRMIDSETRQRLRAELDRLPEALRLPAVLHYQAGCTYPEVAASLGIPEGTVATRLASARERLKASLAMAGILLATDLSLEEALAGATPTAEASPGLSSALRSLAATAAPIPRILGLPRPLLMIGSAALLLVGAGIGIAFRDPPPPSPMTSLAAAPVARPAPVPVPPAPPAMAGKPPSPEPPPGAFRADAGNEEGKETASISGRVTCRETGLPVADAELELHPIWPAFDSGELQLQVFYPSLSGADAHTDADGCFRLAPRIWSAGYKVLPVPFCLTVKAEGYAFWNSLGLRVRDRRAIESFLLRDRRHGTEESPGMGFFPPLSQGEERRMDLQISRGWSLAARILKPDGNPLPAKLTFRWGDREKVEFHSDETPRFDPEVFPPHEAKGVVSAEGFLPMETPPLNTLPSQEGRYELVLTMKTGRILVGTVTGLDHKVVGKARILCWPSALSLLEAREKNRLQEAASGEDGGFRLQGLPTDEMLCLWARSEDAAMADLREIAAGASEACVPLILDAMGEISGRVLDSQGNPVEGAVISAGFSGDREAFEVTRHVESGPDGRFRLGGLPFWKGGWVIARKGRKGVWWAGFSDVPVGVHDLEIRVLGHSKGKLTPYGKR